jgi:hypothetical protein
MRKIRCIIVAMLPLFCAAAALGADDGYVPTQANPAGVWKNWVALGLFTAALAVAAFKNARRTHLD